SHFQYFPVASSQKVTWRLPGKSIQRTTDPMQEHCRRRVSETAFQSFRSQWPISMSHFFSDAQLRAMAEEFDRNGYLRVERALSDEQVSRYNAAVDRHLHAFPGDWMELSDSFCEGINVLPHTADFDEAIENPKTLEILRAIIGEEIAFEEFAI